MLNQITCFGVALFFLLSCRAESQLTTRALSINGHQLVVEVADQPHSMARGLMHRDTLGENEGMLFVFSTPQKVSFWMKNTTIPLSIAYVSEAGKILEIYPLEPLSSTSVVSQSDSIKYALEVNRDWFEKRGIVRGALVSGLASEKR